jgi:putative inorganic carbon (hco3(-)) transporter
MDKSKVFLYCDRTIFTFLCIAIFCLPFSKAGVESFVWPAIFVWLLKRALGFRVNQGSLCRMFPDTVLNKALGLFIIVNVISVIFTFSIPPSLRGLFGKEFKFIAIYFMVIEVVNSSKRLEILLKIIIASIVMVTIDAGWQYFSGVDFLRGYPLTQLKASFGTANSFAGWLIVIIPLLLSLLSTEKFINKKTKILLFALIAILCLFLLITYKRGAWIAFAAGLILMGYYLIKNASLKAKKMFFFVTAGLLAVFLILPQPIRDRIKSLGRISFKYNKICTVNDRLKSILTMDVNSDRILLWKEALAMIKDHPIIGTGLNTYAVAVKQYKLFDKGGRYPHNSYLQMAAETGLLGLSSFFLILFIFFKTGFRYLNQKKKTIALGLTAGICALLLQSCVDTHLYALQFAVLFWFMLGLTVSVVEKDISL